MKEYPLREHIPTPKHIEHICECGHNRNQHETSDMILLSYPPQYEYKHCKICMCPEYKHEVTHTMRLDL